MPRTRTDETAEAKRNQIVEAAERQLLDRGYAGFSVAAVARELELAQNTIYWYFATKDHLFVEALGRILERTMREKRAAEMTLADEIVWFVGQLHELAPLRAALHERARNSEVAADFAHDFRDLLRTMLTNALRDHVTPGELDIAAAMFAATVDGALIQAPDDPSRRRRIVAYALERLTEGRLRPTLA